jgi:hypothetical protein
MSEGACRPASLFRQAEIALRVFPGHEIVAQLAIGANRDRSTSPFCISAGAATANSRENFFHAARYRRSHMASTMRSDTSGTK